MFALLAALALQDPVAQLEERKAAAIAWIAQHRGISIDPEIPLHSMAADEYAAGVLDEVQAYLGQDLDGARDMFASAGLLPKTANLERIREIAGRFIADRFVGFYRDGEITFIQPDRVGESTLVHELIHAADDAQFHFNAWRMTMPMTFDRMVALQCLIEGDAKVWTALWGGTALEGQTAHWETEAAEREAARGVRRTPIPLLFEWTGSFAYERGPVFVARIWESGGRDAVDRAFHRPPSSTAQILDAQKYLDGVEPVEIELAPVAEALRADGWRRMAETTLGEYGLWMVLQDRGVENAREPARLWRGDRLAAFRRGDEIGGVWALALAEPAPEVFDALRPARGSETTPVARRYGSDLVLFTEGLAASADALDAAIRSCAKRETTARRFGE